MLPRVSSPWQFHENRPFCWHFGNTKLKTKSFYKHMRSVTKNSVEYDDFITFKMSIPMFSGPFLACEMGGTCGQPITNDVALCIETSLLKITSEFWFEWFSKPLPIQVTWKKFPFVWCDHHWMSRYDKDKHYVPGMGTGWSHFCSHLMQIVLSLVVWIRFLK